MGVETCLSQSEGNNSHFKYLPQILRKQDADTFYFLNFVLLIMQIRLKNRNTEASPTPKEKDFVENGEKSRIPHQFQLHLHIEI